MLCHVYEIMDREVPSCKGTAATPMFSKPTPNGSSWRVARSGLEAVAVAGPPEVASVD